MMWKIKKILHLFLVLLLVILLSACGNSVEEQQEIIDMFSSFENSDQYILATPDTIHIGNKIIELKQITYEDRLCHFILSDESGMYAYAYVPHSDNRINIVYIDYETLTATYLASMNTKGGVIATEFYDNKLCFRIDDPSTDKFNQLYRTYDIFTCEIQSIDTNDFLYNIERSGDHNRSSVYRIQSGYNLFGSFLDVTNKETGETKRINNSCLKTGEEGQKIISLGRINMGSGCTTAFEKDGDIYVAFLYITDGVLGNPCHYYIMKYNFESNTMQYYTSVFFEEYPKAIVDLYIP